MIPWTLRCSTLEDFALQREALRQEIRRSLGSRGEGFFVAINEGVANALRHGTLPGELASVTVTLAEEGPFVVVEIQDRGTGLPSGALERDFPSPDEEGGRGMPLMVRLADEVSYDMASHTLRLAARRPAAPPVGDDISDLSKEE